MFPRLYPIVDTEVARRAGLHPVRIAAALLDAGAGILQFRHKGPFGRDVFAQASEIGGLCRGAGAKYVINDRADIALLLGAGLHLGQDDLPFDAARRVLSAGDIGFSTHNETQFLAAPEGAAYVALGPIFDTQSKSNPDPVVGISELRRIAGRKKKPLVAIGGISLERAADVWAAGADSIAVISALLSGGATEAGIRETAKRWLAAGMV